MEIEGERDLAALAFLLYPRIERVEETDTSLCTEADAVADRKPLARPGESLPARAVETLMQQGLDPGFGIAAPDPLAGECSRNDFRLVEDQHIARLEQPRQVAHAAILQAIRLDDKQLRRVARLRRPERDAVLRQVEIEIGDAH